VKPFVFVFMMLLLVSLAAACGNGFESPTPIATPSLPTLTVTLLPGIPAPTPTVGSTITRCAPTMDDGLSPSYKPNAPIRSNVGRGHVLTGVVRSAVPVRQLPMHRSNSGQNIPDKAIQTTFVPRYEQIVMVIIVLSAISRSTFICASRLRVTARWRKIVTTPTDKRKERLTLCWCLSLPDLEPASA